MAPSHSVTRAWHGVVIGLGALLILVGTLAGVVNREVLDADRFAAHVDTVRTDPDVSRELGAVITERLLEQQPDLVALRPLVESTATDLVASPAVSPLVRSVVAPLYRALVLGQGEDPLVLRLADVAAVVIGVVTEVSPQARATVPPDLDVRLSELGGAHYDTTVVSHVHWVAWIARLCPLLGLLLLGVGGVLLAPRGARVRGLLREVGRGALVAGLGLALVVLTVAFLARRADRSTLDGALAHAAWAELSSSFWLATALVVTVGAVGVLVSREDADLRSLLRPAHEPLEAVGRAIVLGVAGLALLADPMAVLTALLEIAGLGLLVWGVVALVVTIVRTPRARTWAVVSVGVLVAGWIVLVLPTSQQLPTGRAALAAGEGCNGHVELCSRRYDEVVFPATHNSMSAADIKGWFFPEQPDGIVAQLDHGIRVLLVDSWYGQRTDRPGVVATAEESRAKAIAEARDTYGAATVDSALRLQQAFGLAPRGRVQPYLCHAMCELGSTPWLDSLRDTRTWLEQHPTEVVTLFVQDEVSPADTADLIEKAGLLPYVYTPSGDPATAPWPTLGQMIDSGKRLVVLMEKRGGGEEWPWLLQGFRWVQDTPYLFRSPAEFSCDRNRGPADAPLFLVNHWISDKRATVSNAAKVNARGVLLRRVEQCERERDRPANFVAVDYYDQGDLMSVVDTLNGLD
ncbi:hypothetical protein [Nocardioides sp.]|uniref:hypothetical protein n=1 Tax=Nocardioides sp. TaxID=35761 RepID=UPI0037837446